MIGAVSQRSFEVDNRVTGEYAFSHSLAQTLFDGGMEVLRNASSENLLFKYQILGSPGSNSIRHLRTGRDRRSASCGGPEP